jgi:MFS family permease
MGLLLYVTISGADQLWQFFVLAALTGVLAAIGNPAGRSLVPELVPAELLTGAIAMRSIAGQITTIGGPAIGGLLFALQPEAVYSVAVVLLVASSVMLFGIARPEIVERLEPAAPGLDSLLGGIRFIRSSPVILGAITLDLFAVLLGSVTALLPIYARDILHVGPDGLGIMRSSIAAGAVGMGLLLAYLPPRRHPHAGRAMFGGVAVFGLAVLVFGVSRNYALSVAALLVMGASDMISVYVRATVIQLGTPDAMRGRVSAIHTLFVGAANEFGDFRAGLVAAGLGSVPAVMAGGLCTLAVVALWTRFFPALRRVDRLSDVSAEPVHAARPGSEAAPYERQDR